MHEMSLMRGLMRQIEDIAEKDGAGRVVAVRVKLGSLSHFSPEHFTEHFVEASRGSIADGARLEIETMTDPHHPQAMDVILESLEVQA